MPIREFPFLGLTDDNIPRPWLPVRIINPATGDAQSAYGLVDTGADETTVPAYLAHFLGHDLKAVRPKRISTAAGEANAYPHTTKIQILDGRGRRVYTIADTLIDYVEGLEVVLLGVKGFLDNFYVFVKYPKQKFSIISPGPTSRVGGLNAP